MKAFLKYLQVLGANKYEDTGVFGNFTGLIEYYSFIFIILVWLLKQKSHIHIMDSSASDVSAARLSSYVNCLRKIVT